MKEKKIPLSKAFVINGKKITSLEQLLFEVENLTDEEYKNYVKENENFIGDWIYYVLKDLDLAEKIRNTKSRKGAIEVLKQAVFESKHKTRQVTKKKKKGFLTRLFSRK